MACDLRCRSVVTHSWFPDHFGVAVAWAGLAALAYLVFLVFQPFLNPLGWAAVIAVVFYPVHARFEHRWGASRAAALSTLAVTAIVVVPLLFVAGAFVREAIDAVGGLQRAFDDGRPGWVERPWSTLVRLVPAVEQLDLASLATDAGRSAAMWLAAQSGSALQHTARFVFDLVLALFATFFLLRDSRAIMATIRRLLPMDEASREHLIARTAELVSVSVRSSAIVAGLQGALGGIVFAAVGIDAPVFWGVVMAFFCLLPFGAWVIWLPAALLLAANGAVGRGLIVAALGFGIVSAVDNVLRPMLLSGHTAMNGLLVFVSLLGGMAVFGALGLVLGPLVVATAVAFLATYVNSTRPGPPEHGS